MTTANKIPANWQDGLRIADEIAARVDLALREADRVMGTPDDCDLAAYLYSMLRGIGEIVGSERLDKTTPGQ